MCEQGCVSAGCLYVAFNLELFFLLSFGLVLIMTMGPINKEKEGGGVHT